MNMRATYADKKVEFKTKKAFSNCREVYYRIAPSELKWWERLFNPWRQMYRALKFVGGICEVFELKNYHDLVFPLKTYGDVVNFLAEQERLGNEAETRINARIQEKIAKGEEWPD